MSTISRRAFLAASASLAAAPALGAVPASGEVDIVIVGAGAAGIAAARRVAQAGRRYALIEAADRIGGRCITDTTSLGAPFDRGARALFVPEANPVAQLATKTGIELQTGPRLQRLRIGRRFGREGEVEDFLSFTFRARRAITEAARARADFTADKGLPKDLLSDWQPTVNFVLGTYAYGTELDTLSAFDLARAMERDSLVYARGGLGALLARLGAGLNVQTGTPATKIEWGKALEVETSRGRLRAKAIIVTASASVLAANKIQFSPELPRTHADAFSRVKLGTRDHIAFELPANALGLAPNDLVFEKAAGARTAALYASGSNVCVIDVGGKFGAELSRSGEAAMTDFGLNWLAELYGNDIKTAVKRRAVTRWNENPWTLGAISAAAPGGAEARKTLAQPVRDRLYFAGDAVHETLAGTVGGAWESGTRAAEAALRKLGVKIEVKQEAAQEVREDQPRRRRRSTE